MDLLDNTGLAHASSKMVQIVSDTITDIVYIVNNGIVNFTISLFGVAANVVNIMVFFRHGFDNTINISFFGLAISDLCSLVTMMWFAVCINPYLADSGTDMVPLEIIHLTAGIPHICFARITGWITVFVTAERCLCITIPLKIKRIITPKVTKIAICFIYISIIISYVPEYATSYIDWKFYPERNKTLLGMVFTSNRKGAEGLVFFLYAILGSASFLAVIAFTVLLVVQLKQKSNWRKKANLDKARSETISIREAKTVTMVVMIAVVLIVSYIPGVIISMSSFLYPEFSFLGTQLNVFFVTWSFAFIFETVNSSVNIFFYYRMSTKYRDTFHDMFDFSWTRRLKMSQEGTNRNRESTEYRQCHEVTTR